MSADVKYRACIMPEQRTAVCSYVINEGSPYSPMDFPDLKALRFKVALAMEEEPDVWGAFFPRYVLYIGTVPLDTKPHDWALDKFKPLYQSTVVGKIEEMV
jgi:hypothetical protein